jgi:general secretion pathway protein D
MHRKTILILWAVAGLFAAGCPKGGEHYKAARKAEDLQDYDTALQYYQKALASDPQNADYRIKFNQARFEAGAFQIKKGQELREQGDLQGAAAEFQRAATIDPGSSIAAQEFRNTVDQINDLARKQDAAAAAGPNNQVEPDLASAPPELKPLSDSPVSLKMVNDVKIIFDTIAKQAGINVIYDPDFPARRISVELNNVTLQQALDIVSLQSKTFWKPVTENIIFVAQDTTQKHKDYDEQMVETFYLSNTIQSQDLTEIANGLRQVLNLTKVQQLNSQNAIIVRDTPDKLAIARRLLKDIDKAKPEVLIQVEVLSASTDRLRDLGVLPGQSASLTFTPPGTTSTSGSSTTTNTGAPLRGFSLSADYYTVTLPGATANFVLTDTTTKIIQNPEIRSIDGQPAKLNIGSRVPIATGSFQAGVGVGTTSVNPLVNTQFTYIDVGVNVNITPRIHPNHEISLKVALEVSQVTGTATIGGIQQPIIGQNKIEHDIRLREGEANILGGLFTKTDSKTVNGWPGLAQIPLMKYLFADNKVDHAQSDILIVMIPRIVRLPDWTRGDLRPISSGVEQNITTRRQSDIRTPENPKAPAPQAPAQQPPAEPPMPGVAPLPGQPQPGTPQAAVSGQGARLRFDPQTLTLAPGQTATLGIAVDNVNDLYSIPMMLQYDPAVISIEDVQHGTFLSSGNQEIAIVQGGDKSKGQVMIAATRQPNTPGVSGSGTLLGVVVKAIGPGATNLSIVQVNAKDSQQKPLALLTTEANVQVKPQ